MPPTPTATSADAASFIESFRARLRDAIGNLVGHVDNFVTSAEGKIDTELSGLHEKLGEAHDIVNGILAEPVPANLKVPAAAPAPAPAPAPAAPPAPANLTPETLSPNAAPQESQTEGPKTAINPGGS